MISRPHRAAGSLSAAVVLASAVAAVAMAMVHGGPVVTVLAAITGGALAACAIVRLDAVATPGAATAAGIGGAARPVAVMGMASAILLLPTGSRGGLLDVVGGCQTFAELPPR